MSLNAAPPTESPQSPRAAAGRHRRLPLALPGLPWLALLASLLLGLALPSPTAAGPIRLVADAAVADSVRQLLRTADARHRGIGASILPSMDPLDALHALRMNQIEAVLVAGPLPAAELGADLTALAWVRTPLILAANEGVPINNVKLEEMLALLAGWVNRWPDGTPVRLLLPPPDSRDLMEVVAAAKGIAPALARARQRPGLIVVPSDEETAHLLETLPGSLGFSTLGYTLARPRHFKPLLIDGVEPSLTNERLGLYRLQRIIFVVHRRQLPRPVAMLLEFLLAERHHAFLMERGLTPVRSPAMVVDLP